MMENNQKKWFNVIKPTWSCPDDYPYFKDYKEAIEKEHDTAKLASYSAQLIHGWTCNYKLDVNDPAKGLFWKDRWVTGKSDDPAEQRTLTIRKSDYHPCEDANQAFALLDIITQKKPHKIRMTLWANDENYEFRISNSYLDISIAEQNNRLIAIVKACLIAAATLAWEYHKK